MENIKIFACSKYAEPFTKEICEYLDIPMGKINTMKFKNDNNFVQILETVREHDVYLVQSNVPPVNERIMELLITIDAVKRASAGKINVVLPYYIYSRSDKKDQPRVPITAKLIAELLEAAGATRVITCDLHNPAIQAYFNNINCDRLSAEGVLEDYFMSKKLDNMVIVATDAGSSKKAYKYSEFFNCPIAMLDKRRDGNNDKAIGTTIIGEAIYAGCTHGVLSGPAIERIQNSPIKELVITNTIPLSEEKQIPQIKVVSIAPLFAETIKRLNEKRPLGELLRKR